MKKLNIVSIALILILVVVLCISIWLSRVYGPSAVDTTTPVPSSSQSVNIHVFKPQPYDVIGSPVVIQGEARVFESTFSYRVKDANGKILYENHAMANAPDAGLFGSFDLNIVYSRPSTDRGSIEVFEYSAKDGSEINKVTIPVRFKVK